jgi:hypothetical protein
MWAQAKGIRFDSSNADWGSCGTFG